MERGFILIKLRAVFSSYNGANARFLYQKELFFGKDRDRRARFVQKDRGLTFLCEDRAREKLSIYSFFASKNNSLISY